MSNTFYDIHCHAMNFSHPNLDAFLRRKWSTALLASPLMPLLRVFMDTEFRRAENLLGLMENDLADFFLIMEYYLKPMIRNGELAISGTVYDKIVLTPLLIDFGFKGIPDSSFYSITPQKPIIEQVVDVFSGIKDYCDYELQLDQNGRIIYQNVQDKSAKLFEIYPFLAVNTKNYSLPELQDKLLEKYFGGYSHNRESLFERMGNFTGDIEEMGSNFFAGIKLYPPLGFDPWPESGENWKKEREKVEYLYHTCCEKNIPITTHCNEGGFSLDDNAQDLTNPGKWAKVLANPSYKKLRLNFAHFGQQKNSWIFKRNTEWQETILELIDAYENVYTDISYNGVKDGYYAELKTLTGRQKDAVFRETLKQRILFGSDFMINLLEIDSYNDYLRKYADYSRADPDFARDQNAFCTTNPERFLFG